MKVILEMLEELDIYRSVNGDGNLKWRERSAFVFDPINIKDWRGRQSNIFNMRHKILTHIMRWIFQREGMHPPSMVR